MKISNLLKVGAAVVAILSVAAVQAQGFGGQGRGTGMMMGRGGATNRSMLLARADVRDDLALSGQQAEKLDTISNDMRAKMMGIFQNGGGGDREAMRATMTKMLTEVEAEVMKVLTPEQTKRLKEIQVQLLKARAAGIADIAKDLGITDAQKAKIDELNKKVGEASQALFAQVRSGELTMEDVQAKMKKNDGILVTEIEKVLTEAQKTKLKAMEGTKKFVEAEG